MLAVFSAFSSTAASAAVSVCLTRQASKLITAFAGFEVFPWRALVIGWALTLVPSWMIARCVRRWVECCVEAPQDRIVNRCWAIRGYKAPRTLLQDERNGVLLPVVQAVNALLSWFDRTIAASHRCMADAAHELRTPLTAQAVVGENALTAKNTTRADLREAVSSMLEESRHMKGLIESLSTISRVSATRLSDAPQNTVAVDLSRMARSCVQSLQALAEEKSQFIAVSAAVPLQVQADVTMLRQALFNVIHNAIEHCPEGTHIEVSTAQNGSGESLVRIADDGPGIPAQDQLRVFERFYRSDGNARRRSKGLGLAIAKAILTAQGGRIELQSTAGAGCCFTLVLPSVSSLLADMPSSPEDTVHIGEPPRYLDAAI